MPSKKKHYELPDEVFAVLDCSSDLEPCKTSRHANICHFADHMKNDKCEQGITAVSPMTLFDVPKLPQRSKASR